MSGWRGNTKEKMAVSSDDFRKLSSKVDDWIRVTKSCHASIKSLKGNLTTLEEKVKELEENDSIEKEIETIQEQRRKNMKEIEDISQRLLCIESEYVAIKETVSTNETERQKCLSEVRLLCEKVSNDTNGDSDVKNEEEENKKVSKRFACK